MTAILQKSSQLSKVLLHYGIRFSFFLIIFFHQPSVSGQSLTTHNKIDSLIIRLSELDQSPEKVDVLNNIGSIYSSFDGQRAKEYGTLALKLAEKISYPHGELMANNLLGEIHMFYELDVVQSVEYLNKAMQLANELNDKEMQIRILKDYAYFSANIGEKEESNRYYQMALSVTENISLREYIDIYGRIANNYLELGDTTNSLKYYELIQNHPGSEAQSDSSQVIAIFYAEYFILKNQYENAFIYSQKALDISIRINSNSWIAYCYSFRGRLNKEIGNLDDAIADGLKGAEIAEEFGLNKERLDNYNLLVEAYLQKKDFENSTKYLMLSRDLNNTLYQKDEQNRKRHYETVMDDQQRKLQKDRAFAALRAKQLQSENDRLLIRSITIGLIITFVFLFVLYRRLIKGTKLYHQLQNQKEELLKLSIVAANIEQMVMIVGSDDRIEWVNKAFEQKFGYSREKAINKTPLELLGGDLTDREQVRSVNETIFEEKIPFEAKLIQYSANKKPFLTRLHISPIVDDENDLERYVVISHDITAEQKVAEELKELSLVASNTTNSIVILDKSLQIIWVNNGFTKLTGYTSKYTLGKKLEEFYSSTSFVKGEKINVKLLYAAEKPFSVEQEVVNRYTNKTNWISISVTPVFDEQEQLVKYISVATDITTIKELEAQYESLVEGSTDMIYEIDVQGRFMFVNDVMSNALGFSKEEIKQTHFLNYVADDDKDRVENFYKNQVIIRQTTSHIEFKALTKKGDLIWVGQRARIKWNDKGDRVVGFSVVTRDITDQKKVEETLIKTHDNARLLSEIGMQITSTHSIPDIIDQVYDNINILMDANVFGIAIPNKEGSDLIFPHIIEKGKPLNNFKLSLKDENRLAVICYTQGKEIIISDLGRDLPNFVQDTEFVAPIAGEQTLSIIYLPLYIRGSVIGVLTVQSFDKYAYDEYQVSLVKSLASFVAIAMENAGLYETMEDKIAKRTLEVRKQKEELEVNYFNTRVLSEIGQLIASSLNLDKNFDQLYEKVGLLMDAEIFAIRLYDEKTNTIQFKYTIEKGERCEPFSITMDEVDNYNVWCIQNRKEIFLNDNRNEFQNYVKEIQVLQGEMPNSLLFYPMIVENKVIGVITIQSFKLNAYQPYHLDILKTLATYIGTALDNAELYATLEHKVHMRTEELEQKNNDITSSINYAKRLQKGILPDKSFMRQLLPDSFVYFKPKDIVSGDFYWVDRTQNKVLFAVVDCTGHGVPGAMMSIIGRNLLDQAVNEKGLTLPSQILNFLQVGLSLAFGQTGERKADLFDGMDLALCSIDFNENILEFAGANNSLYLIQDNELIVLKGDKIGISAEYEITHFYTNVEIEIKKGDVIYLTSDGFPDQFGGERHKKFTYNRMEELFMSIYQDEMHLQFDTVKETILNWKGENEQTDDICIMGIRIT